MRKLHAFSPFFVRIDDVEDDSALRRGVPAAHHLYGVPQTINCANYVYFLALSELVKLDNPAMVKIYTGKHSNSVLASWKVDTLINLCSSHVDELLNLHRGQGMELFWRDTLTCPTEAEFLEMVDNSKCGCLEDDSCKYSNPAHLLCVCA